MESRTTSIGRLRCAGGPHFIATDLLEMLVLPDEYMGSVYDTVLLRAALPPRQIRSLSWSNCDGTVFEFGLSNCSRASFSRNRPATTSAPLQARCTSVTARWRFSSAISMATRNG